MNIFRIFLFLYIDYIVYSALYLILKYLYLFLYYDYIHGNKVVLQINSLIDYFGCKFIEYSPFFQFFWQKTQNTSHFSLKNKSFSTTDIAKRHIFICIYPESTTRYRRHSNKKAPASRLTQSLKSKEISESPSSGH